MPKRFTATEKWSDPWFCSLNERDRLFWVYLLDACDHAGVWRKNDMLLNVYFPDYVFKAGTFKGRLIKISEEKWFIPKFLGFQYGVLNPLNRAHLSVLTLLKKEGLEAPSKPLLRGYQGAKDKDKVKVKDKKGSLRGNKNSQVDPYDIMKAQGKIR
jgi:hypothetical protein